jgi:hypothetical protein
MATNLGHRLAALITEHLHLKHAREAWSSDENGRF